MSAGADSEISTAPESPPTPSLKGGRKPRFAIFIATACGLGYLPKAPGTWGSLAGLLLAMAPYWFLFSVGLVSRDRIVFSMSFLGGNEFDPFFGMQIWLAILMAACGLWSAQRASAFWCVKDPQSVVIDEVSGQHLTLLLGLAMPIWWKPVAPPWDGLAIGLITARLALNWKYLVLGFILFRVFDIWKPFPARQAESLPGGWGIMADDWAAAVYAGIGLWIARAAGL
jgi:phosphatidylglycerophosphatase A